MTAWDWYFSQKKPAWVIVTLKNGSRVYGLFGRNSFAGNDPDRRDLYLEATYRLLSNGEWAPNEDTRGILILGDQIAVIEFRYFEEVGDE
jgi:Family of unknown function (DUF6338)